MDELIIVSVDGHAQMPPELWPEYLESRHHHLLDGLHEDQQRYAEVMQLIFDRAYPDPDVFDGDGIYRAGGWRGLYDTDIRMAEMDREGVAGEFVNTGDGRFVALFFEPSSRAVSAEACRAGVRAYHRWAHEALGDHPDRLFLIGSVGHAPCMDLEPTLAELDWIADHGYRATTLPGKTAYPGDLPLSDPYWEPFWARCADRGVNLWIHGGHGQRQGSLAAEVADAYAQYEASGRDPERFWQILITSVFNGELLESPAPRQAMWQIMLSGVFDRYPELRLNMNEVRGDWVPATIAHLDEVWHANRADLPALRPPSEYWAENCQAGLSFVHRAEVERRHEIGVATIGFGRDYPHSEGTWPNTLEWLRDAFAGVPEDEVRMILGENAIRTFGLDHAELATIASGVGPTFADIAAPGPVDPALVAHFGDRGGYLKAFEGDRRVPEMVPLVRQDVADLAGRSPATASLR
jgi:predicted TIM-barrel fold metal-dependent hydrolase